MPVQCSHRFASLAGRKALRAFETAESEGGGLQSRAEQSRAEQSRAEHCIVGPILQSVPETVRE